MSYKVLITFNGDAGERLQTVLCGWSGRFPEEEGLDWVCEEVFAEPRRMRISGDILAKYREAVISWHDGMGKVIDEHRYSRPQIEATRPSVMSITFRDAAGGELQTIDRGRVEHLPEDQAIHWISGEVFEPWRSRVRDNRVADDVLRDYREVVISWRDASGKVVDEHHYPRSRVEAARPRFL